MSAEVEELRRIARTERGIAWEHARRLPARAGDAASAFARRHPLWTMAGAAALAMGVASRRRRRFGIEGKPSTWPMALAAVGANWLPEILRLAGLTGARPAEGRANTGRESAPPA